MCLTPWRSIISWKIWPPVIPTNELSRGTVGLGPRNGREAGSLILVFGGTCWKPGDGSGCLKKGVRWNKMRAKFFHYTVSVATAARAVERLIFRTRSLTLDFASMMDVLAMEEPARVNEIAAVVVLGGAHTRIVVIEIDMTKEIKGGRSGWRRRRRSKVRWDL
jgi:hypothetical protein